MAYDFTVETRGEFESLQWIAVRYDYAEVLEKALLANAPADWDSDNGVFPATFKLPEHTAWEIQEAIADEDGFLTCLGGRLREEVISLLDRIV